MKRIRASKIATYAFVQILVMAFARKLVSPLIPIISEELGVGLDYIGSAISLSIFGVFFVSITTGNLIETFGLKKVLLVGLAINSIGSVLLFFSNTFPLFIIAYFLLEMSAGMLIIGKLSIVGTFYPHDKTSTLIKINYGITITYIIAPLLVSFLLFEEINWRYYYLIHPVLFIILMVILWRMDIPMHIKVSTSIRRLFHANKRIISNPAFALCGFIILFYVAVLRTFSTWFTTYYSSLGVDVNISSIFLSIYGVALFLGMALRIKLIQHIKKKRTLFFSFIIVTFMLAGIIFIDNLIAKNILMFLFGLSIAGGFSITVSIASGLLPKYTNSAFGITLAFANVGEMIFQYLSGFMYEHFSGNSVLYLNLSVLLLLIALTALLNFHSKFQKVY